MISKPLEGARLEQIVYTLADGQAEIVVGWVKEIKDDLLGDGYIGVYQVSTGKELIGSPEIISEANIIKREPLYTPDEWRTPWGRWDKKFSDLDRADFRREYMGEWVKNDEGEKHE